MNYINLWTLRVHRSRSRLRHGYTHTLSCDNRQACTCRCTRPCVLTCPPKSGSAPDLVALDTDACRALRILRASWKPTSWIQDFEPEPL